MARPQTAFPPGAPTRVALEGADVVVEWADRPRRVYHPLWLRDNCPCPECRHPGTGERLVDTALLPDHLAVASARADDGNVEVVWAADGHVSRYPAASLARPHRPRRRRTLWRAADFAAGLPEGRYENVGADGAALRDWLAAIDEYGFARLAGVPAEDGAVTRVAELFGFVRETNYGRVFDVRSVVNPNNLAYTGLALGPHTDNPYRDPVPTLQLLHCLQSSASGGDSTLVDGFAVAESLRADDHEKFDLLARTPVPFTFRDAETELVHEAPVVRLDVRGEIEAVRYSTRAAAPFDLSDELIGPYYDAYRTFGRMLVSPEFQVGFKLEAGDLFIVDNRRVLHGRKGYSGGGTRHLQGCYADVDALRSRLAVLSR